MKINKRNPLHWLYLFFSSMVSILALILRPIISGRKNVILLYGHKLNGNLLSIYSQKNAIEKHGFKVYFITMDYHYYRNLATRNVDGLLLLSLHSAFFLAKTTAIISDHGLHSLSLFLKRTDICFFDVWHGIPFKGFDKDDFVVQQKYNEIWVSSEHLKNLYINKFGFKPQQIEVTGYGRTDRLVNSIKCNDNATITNLKNKFKLPFDNRKIILFAPTWKQDDQNRNELPFSIKPDELLNNIKEICNTRNSIFIIRSHLNSQINGIENKDPIYIRSHSDYPDSEELLMITNLLICDWSSIAFDFLVLDKPTIFLDVPAPFKKGFSLGPEYRFGKIVKEADDLYQSISKYIDDAKEYQREFLEKHNKIKERVYGNTLDGCSVARYIDRLCRPLIAPSTRAN